MLTRTSEYQKRELEDHIAVAAFIFNEAGELFVMRHLKWGFWSIPVGKGEEGETAEEALRREMKEELGFSTYDVKVVYEQPSRYDRSGTSIFVQLVGFEVSNIKEDFKNMEPGSHQGLGFLPISEIVKKEALSDQLMLYLDLKGIKHGQTPEGVML